MPICYARKTMALNIVVCVKSIPSTVNVGVDASGRPKIVGVPTIMNPFDEFAVEAVVRLKEGVPGSTVTALSVGSDAAAEILREAIARGADGGARLSPARSSKAGTPTRRAGLCRPRSRNCTRRSPSPS